MEGFMVSWELWERRRKYFVEVNFDPFDPASNVTRYIERRSQSEVMYECLYVLKQ